VVMSSMYQSITYSLKSKFRTFEFNGERYHNKRSSLAFDVGSFIVEVCDSVSRDLCGDCQPSALGSKSLPGQKELGREESPREDCRPAKVHWPS